MRFLRFWWDFVVGDDWRAALGIAAAIAATALVEVWWLLPAAFAAVLVESVARGARKARNRATVQPPDSRGNEGV